MCGMWVQGKVIVHSILSWQHSSDEMPETSGAFHHQPPFVIVSSEDHHRHDHLTGGGSEILAAPEPLSTLVMADLTERWRRNDLNWSCGV
ncbi:hypothetical protein DY000_02044207 [Brassica cretica]|uniref:Uncharacterized protein n=1 Tax=Brassica cretica TaxID=69181 RepID=A0ABQ7EWE6_BRACR|nr:hypothetical protein DY000_02044207 [Brassica cretica]